MIFDPEILGIIFCQIPEFSGLIKYRQYAINTSGKKTKIYIFEESIIRHSFHDRNDQGLMHYFYGKNLQLQILGQ